MSVSHKQTGYVAAPVLDEPEPLPLPELTDDLEQARRDLAEFGMCLYGGALQPAEVRGIGAKLLEQAGIQPALVPPTPSPIGMVRELERRGATGTVLVLQLAASCQEPLWSTAQ